MGDADGQSEAHIQSSGEYTGGVEQRIREVDQRIREGGQSIRGVEQHILRLEEEIEELKPKIEGVEKQIETCSDPKLQALLLGKEAQLRTQAEQLRTQAEQLRTQAEQLRGEEAELLAQQRENYTEFGWLRQELPSWNSRSLSLTPSTTPMQRVYSPARVEYWDVVPEIEEYLGKADNLKRIYQKVDNPTITRGERNSKDVAAVVVSSTCDYLSKKLSGSSVHYAREVNLEVPPDFLGGGVSSTNPDGSETLNRDVRNCLFYARPPRADIIVRSDNKDAAVLELKNGGLACHVPIFKLWAKCSCRTGIDLNCWCNSNTSPNQARSILKCVVQLYEYLVLARAGYGVLTDIQNWYLFRRDQGGCLYISTGFKWDGRQPPLPAVIAYLVKSAVETRGEFDVLPTKGERPWIWEGTPCTSPSGGSEDDQDTDRTYKPKKHNACPTRTSPPSTRQAGSNTRQNKLREIPASDLHLDDRPISSGGWSGCVVGGTLNGRRVAVKLAPRDSERAEALLNEVSAYQKLQKYWGEFVPSLVGYGTTVDDQIVFMATELIDGSPLGPGIVTEDVATAAHRALGVVHACKLLHGDIEARNIMVVQGTQNPVRLIDFGFAKRCNNWRAHQAEVEQLESILADMMGVGVGKEFGVTYPHEQLCLV